MINYTVNNLKDRIIYNNGKVVVFGFGTVGRLTLKSLKNLEIKVDYFCDSDSRKHNMTHDAVKVVSPDELFNFEKNANIFISNDYFRSIVPMLKEKNFTNLFNSTELLNHANIEKIYDGDLYPLKLKRRIDFYNEMAKKEEYVLSGLLKIKSVDIQITERCSLKCKDCSNLMQYYERPVNSELDILFKSLDVLMSAVDHVNEFRVIGGDPFMNKDMYKIVNRLVKYKNNSNVVIYTNATILPKKDQLECLKNKKVILEITNYGPVSRAHDELVKLAEKEGIGYSTYRCTTWQDCGRIVPHSNKSEKQIEHQFSNCCISDLVTLLHGKLYRCPFSANGTNLNAFDYNDSEIVDLNNSKISENEIKKQIKELCYDKKYLSACFHCNGRDYTSTNIKSAIQTKKPLNYNKVRNDLS